MILLQKKKLKFRAGELVQWLKVLTKCPGLVPSERIKKKKAKWVSFGPCQGMSLSKHARYNRISIRGLLGDRCRGSTSVGSYISG